MLRHLILPLLVLCGLAAEDRTLVPYGGRLVPLPATRLAVRDGRPPASIDAIVRLRSGHGREVFDRWPSVTVGGSPTIEGMDGVWQISVSAADAGILRAIAGHDAVMSIDASIPRRLRVRGDPTADPLFSQQIHLRNGIPGMVDLDVVPAWTSGVTGAGINIAIVDTGLELTHPDLAPNLRTDLSWDVFANDGNVQAEDGVDSSNHPYENHGTVVAGVAAAVGGNGIGVSGTAPAASIVGVRFIVDGSGSDAKDAQALSIGVSATASANQVGVSNNSWGPVGGAPISQIARQALANGVASGRGGKGVIYVFASGNDGDIHDTSDYDEFASNPYVMDIGATEANGTVADYSMTGLNVFACAPVGGGITSTDRLGSKGYNPTGDYITASNGERGTSFAAPQISGVVALLLSARPEMTWRDVRHAIARTARQVAPSDPGWLSLPNGLHWHRSYGFGLVDAAAAVTLVRSATWSAIASEATAVSAVNNAVKTAIPDSASSGAVVPLLIRAPSGMRVETVEFTVDATHADERQIEYAVISPSGTESTVIRRQLSSFDMSMLDITSTAAYPHVFCSLRHWGEPAYGEWKVVARDLVSGTTGTLNAVSLTIHGYVDPGTGTAGTVIPADPGGSTTGGGTAGTPAAAPPIVLGGDGGGGGMCGLGSTLGLVIGLLFYVGSRHASRSWTRPGPRCR